MDVAKIVTASVALIFSGWCLYDAHGSSRMLHQVQATHRSVEDELRRMQQRPEEALVLWIPGEAADSAPSELLPVRKSPSKRAGKATAWPLGQVPNLAEAR